MICCLTNVNKLFDSARNAFYSGIEMINPVGRLETAVAIAAASISIYACGALSMPTIFGVSVLSGLAYVKLKSDNQKKLFNDLLKNYFEIHTNCQNNKYEDAEVLCLGERHHSNTNKFLNCMVISHFSRPDKDLILLEFDPNETAETDQLILSPENKIQVTGWDDRSFEPSEIEEIQYKEALKELKIIKTKLPSARQKNNKKGIAELENAALNASDVIRSYLEKSSVSFLKRNENLIKVIEDNRKKGRKIFVIAGKDHLDPLKEGSFLFEDKNPQAVEKVFQYLNKMKYVVFNIKNEILESL